jgi:hypothetical protein
VISEPPSYHCSSLCYLFIFIYLFILYFLFYCSRKYEAFYILYFYIPFYCVPCFMVPPRQHWRSCFLHLITPWLCVGSTQYQGLIVFIAVVPRCPPSTHKYLFGKDLFIGRFQKDNNNLSRRFLERVSGQHNKRKAQPCVLLVRACRSTWGARPA